MPMNDKIIDSLFGSKTKARLLKLFLHNPELSFNLEQLSGKTKLPKSAIKKEMRLLQQLGLIKTTHDQKNNKKKK